MYISRNLEQWNAFLATLQAAFEQGKAQDLLTDEIFDILSYLAKAENCDVIHSHITYFDKLLHEAS